MLKNLCDTDEIDNATHDNAIAVIAMKTGLSRNSIYI